MDFFDQLLQLIRDPSAVIAHIGYGVLALIIFVETGVLAFFLPGDSLLVVAGFYAVSGKLDIVLLNALLIPAAVAGPVVSYWIGAKLGPRLFSRPRSRVFRPEHLKTAHEFYQKHGGAAVVLARFMPIVRTFVPVVAGIARMGYARYTLYNVIGGAAWVLSMTLIGYFLGSRFPGLVKHIELVIVAVVLLSLVPAVIAWLRRRRASPSAKQGA
jgi:membrane-associated protein